MRSSKKIVLFLINIILISYIIVGCGAQKSEISTNDRATTEHDFSESSVEENSIGFGSDSPLEPDKVITTIDLQFETTESINYEELNKIIEKYQGYVEYSNISLVLEIIEWRLCY